MAGLLDLFGQRGPEDPVNYGLLSMSQALGTPVAQGGGVGAAFGAYGHGLQTQAQLLERRNLMRAQEARLGVMASKDGQPANVRTAMWYADPSRTDAEKAAFRASVRSQEKQKIGETLYVKDFDTNQWRPANPLEEQLATVEAGAAAKATGTERVKAAYDVMPSVDAQGNDVYSTRANILGINPAVAPRLSPGGGVQPPFMQPTSKPNLDATGLDAANGYPNKAALNTAIQNVQDPLAQFRPPAAGNAARARNVQEADKIGGNFGDMYNGFIKSGIEAQSTIAKLNRFEQLTNGVETGKLTPTGTEIAGYLNSLNIDIDPNLSNKQAAGSITREMALMLRKPGKESGGMPGNFSDQDRKFLTEIAPSLANTPGGNKLIIELARKMAERDTEMADLADKYYSQNNTMNGFAKVQRDYAAAHPMFGKEDMAKVEALKSGGGSQFSVGQRGKTKDGRDVEFDGTGWKLVK